MNLRTRLRSLERATGATPDPRCRTCGHLLHPKRGQFDPTIKYRASFRPADESARPRPSDICPDCKRTLVYRATIR